MGEHIACRSGTVDSEDPLIGAHSLYLGAGNLGDILKNLLQTGVLSCDAQFISIPENGSLSGFFAHKPLRRFRCGRRGRVDRKCAMTVSGKASGPAS